MQQCSETMSKKSPQQKKEKPNYNSKVMSYWDLSQSDTLNKLGVFKIKAEKFD